jgi:hypothetical protein
LDTEPADTDSDASVTGTAGCAITGVIASAATSGFKFKFTAAATCGFEFKLFTDAAARD